MLWIMDEVNANLPGQMELEMEGVFGGILLLRSKKALRKYALLTEKME